MKTLPLFVLACLAATVAFAQEMSLSLLASRPEFLPSQCTLKKSLKLQGLPAMSAGQTLTIESIRGTNLGLETPNGRSVFSMPAADTDVLERAKAVWDKLNPEQRALTYGTLLQRKDLWTYRVKLTQPVGLNTGDLKPGEAAILVGIEGNQLLLVYEKGNFLFNVPPRRTDLMDSARKLLVDKKAFPSRVSEDLQGKLVNAASGAAATLPVNNDLRYFVFYRGAGWCGPCRQFSPALVKFYKDMKPKYDAFEVFFISGDKTPNEMRAYAKEAGFSWSAVPQPRQPETQIVNRLFTNLIPQFVVTDRSGTVVIDSASVGTLPALKQFESLLKKG